MKKHFKIFIGLVFSVSLILFACNNGQTKSDPKPTPSATLKITFDSTVVVCKKGILGNKGDFISGAEVKEDEWYSFTAILKNEEAVENWYVNNNKKTLEYEKTFTYHVSKKDANEQNVINISYIKKIAEKFKISFDPTLIKAKKGISGGDGDITSGTEVKENEWYNFTALSLTEDEIVDAWYAGKNKKDYDTLESFAYKVRKEDADTKGVINIKFEKRAIKKPIIKFDSNLVECKKGINGTNGDITTGDVVIESTYYKFTAKLKMGEKLKNWTLNGKPRTFEKGMVFQYKIRKDDIDSNNTITIGFEKE